MGASAADGPAAHLLARGREWPVPEGRTVPMEVLVMGLCRTGTMCMFILVFYCLKGLICGRMVETVFLRRVLRCMLSTHLLKCNSPAP